MASLQDQLLKAGLADKQKAKKIKKEKHKKIKAQQKHKLETTNEAKVMVDKAITEKKQKDLALNQERQQQVEVKAIAAQIKQLIEINKQPRKGDVACNFTDGTLIKRIYVDNKTQKAITLGKLAVVRFNDGYELVPMPVADKIQQRNENTVVYRVDEVEEQTTTDGEQDDWYADYEIPDDLTW